MSTPVVEIVFEILNDRSSHQRCIIKNLFLNISQFHRKNPVLESLCNKVASLQGFQHRCFPVNFAKCLRTAIFNNIYEWLLLKGHQQQCISYYFLFHFKSFQTKISLFGKHSKNAYPQNKTEIIFHVFLITGQGDINIKLHTTFNTHRFLIPSKRIFPRLSYQRGFQDGLALLHEC